MLTSQLELVMAQVRPLSWPDKLRLIQWMAEDLQPAAALAAPVTETASSYVSFLGAGRGSFTTPEEAEAFLRQERDAWEN